MTAFLDDRRWLAVTRRDPGADGRFVYAVATTGIYCRPSCPSRRALRPNVSFHAGPAAAERAGFRPCRRCRPADPAPRRREAELSARACRLIDASDPPPPLSALAAAAGLSRHHFHRIFTRVVGVTPGRYARARRLLRARSALRGRASVTGAILGSGFGSGSRFYERSAETLGMTPTEFRRGGPGIAIRHAIVASPLGLLLVAGTARGLCCVRFGKSRAALALELRRDFPRASIGRGDRVFRAWVRGVVDRISHPARRSDLPLDIRGTAFQQRVWQELRRIPAGRTTTYAEVAARIGRPTAVRAVARAIATNPVAVVVPCHRVIRSDGGLSGYRWGVSRKSALLAREKTRASAR